MLLVQHMQMSYQKATDSVVLICLDLQQVTSSSSKSFCGTAGVTASFKRHGFSNAIAVDKLKQSGMLAGIISLDLTSLADQALVLQWLEHPSVHAVFMAPPCGTASAARFIELPNERAPRPLRTPEEPDGVSDLEGVELQRVSAANVLYAFTVEVMEKCCQLKLLCMIENPRNSLFWFVTVWIECNVLDELFFQDHQACMYGSKRPKFTRLCANFEQVHTIAALCDGQHTHEPWGIIKQGNKRTFATSLEVHYPRRLCDAIVQAFLLKFVEMQLKINDAKPSLHHSAKALTGSQSVSMKLPPLVPAYKHRYVVFFLKKQPVWPIAIDIPAEHKILHEVDLGGTVSVEERECRKKRVLEELDIWKVDFSWDSLSSFAGNFDSLKILGVQWEPEEFVSKALLVAHPMDGTGALPDELRFAICQNTKLSCAEVARKRAEFFLYWNQRAKDLRLQEQEIRSQMDPIVSGAVKRKKLALFAEMLEFYGYPDKSVVDELVQGASLIGDVAITRMLPVKFNPALLTEESLRKQSAMRRPLIERDCKSSGDPLVDLEVWNQTMEECNKGWLTGPLTAEEIPLDAPVSKRFGLKQKHKVRLIDDFSESSVNQAVTVHESPTLHTVDVAAASLVYWFQLCGELQQNTALQVRTFDLSSAYRQVGLSEQGRHYAYIRVYNPDTEQWAYFQALVLPFGAVKSVHSFLRLARAIWWLGSVACLLMWTSFYDDYIVFSPMELVRSSELTAAALFELLGWDFASEGRKCIPFSDSCDALGVVFNLQASSTGLATISNTASRVEEIVAEIVRVTDAGGISLTDAQKLRGRMQFAEAQLYGRTGKRCLKALKDACCRRRTKFTDHEILSLKLFAKMLETGKPRVVTWDKRGSLVIFTDACYERDARDLVCGLGAVLIDESSGCKRFFSCALDAEQRSLLGEMSKQQIIFEAETFCAVLAYLVWSEELNLRNSFLYVDNEGTKFCLMKGNSDNAMVDAICAVFAELEIMIQANCWLARVASFSNIADKPSRGDTKDLVDNGFLDDSAKASREAMKLLAFMMEKLGRRAECIVATPS